MRQLIVKEAKELLGSLRGLLLAAAIVLLLAVGLLLGGEGPKPSKAGSPITIGILDKDQSLYSRLLVNYFREDESFSRYAELSAGEEGELRERFARGELDAYLILPRNFAQNLIQIENTSIEVVISTSDTTTAILLKNVLNSYGKYISAVEVNTVALYDMMERGGMEPALIEEFNVKISQKLVLAALSRQSFFERQELGQARTTPLHQYYCYVAVGMFLLYIGLFAGSRLLKEKNLQVFDRGRAAGIPLIAYFGSKLAVHGILNSLAGMAFFMLLGRAAGLDTTAAQYGILAGMALVSLLFGMIPVLWIKNERAYMAGLNVCYVMLAVAGGAMIPVMYLPENFLVLSRLTPIYWFVRLMAA